MGKLNKNIRLSKLAREFNVGISTIVEFLNKKGIQMDSNPNTKVSGEAYDILAKEYSSDYHLKKESEKVSFKSAREKKEVVSIEKDETSEKPNEKSDKEKTKSDSSAEKTAPPKSKLKVVGKIDLEQPNEKSKPENTVDNNPNTGKIENKPKTKSEKVEKPKTENSEKVSPKSTKKTKETKGEENKDMHTAGGNTGAKPEIKLSSDMPEKKDEKLKDGSEELKVVGKIDLDALNQKTRPKKKTKAEKEAERKEKKMSRKPASHKADNNRKRNDDKGSSKDKTPKKPNTQNTSKSESKDEVFKSSTQKLSGPTVVGKIELPVEKKGSTNKNKTKRKRIKKDGEKVNINASKGNNNDNNQQGNKNNRGRNKNNNNQGQNQDRNKFKKLKKKKNVKKEVSEEDVQKQIKDTLARLTSKGGKSKGAKHRKEKREIASAKAMEREEQIEATKNVLQLTEFVTVNELATMMEVPVTDIIGTCMGLGLFVSINQRLDAETIAIVAEEFGFKAEFVSVELQESIEVEEDKEEDLHERPPIVTVMGHVDHGKTSLLDHIRRANVIAGEAGGITQHIGAYNVSLEDGRKITFLDTPGHEAFTAMRARGAQVTDIAIIIVAADDNVMPQTIEAINHASAAGVPIVFAINKIDKPGADPEKIKGELANMNYLVEDWGGKYQCQEISAKNGINIEDLLEKVLLEAEMLELKANPDKRAIGSVIESSLDKGRGYVSTVLVQAGTLKVGDFLLAGSYTGHVKAMFNERNVKIDKVGPSEPALILGLNGAPQAGDNFNIMENEREARGIANKREQLQREQGLRTQKHITLDEIGRRIAIGNFQELNVIVKGDVDGSIEALSDSLIKLSTEEIQVNVIHKAVGQISESDVMLATASNAIIVGFQVRPSVGARKLAENEEIDIRLYSIIYDAIEELKSAMEGMLAPEIKEEITATVEVREIFKISKVGTIAGCMVKEGKIKRTSKVRLIRDGIVIYTGELGSLKRFKDDAKEVVKGYECGLNIEKYNDIKIGDIVEAYEEVEVKKKLS
ncbi:MAG: translation initiation factor IF-2 [Marinifilaceae bacterium]|jgi:translation initiation factor IF-2|nr:translation initiation factor IF-2 [Marinifilaceae bacterium]